MLWTQRPIASSLNLPAGLQLRDRGESARSGTAWGRSNSSATPHRPDDWELLERAARHTAQATWPEIVGTVLRATAWLKASSRELLERH